MVQRRGNLTQGRKRVVQLHSPDAANNFYYFWQPKAKLRDSVGLPVSQTASESVVIFAGLTFVANTSSCRVWGRGLAPVTATLLSKYELSTAA